MTPSSLPLAEPATGRATDLESIVEGRRSVRKLQPDPVPREVVHRAIEAAGWAPSPHGRQPWRFAIVESSAAKHALADAMAGAWSDQLQLDGQDAAVIQIRLQKSLDRVTNAPVIIVPCLYLDELDQYPDQDRQAAERTMAIQSLGAAIQNILLTVYAAGYDAGWMCGPLFCPDVVRDALGISKSMIPHAMIPVGLAAADPVRRPRMAVDELIAGWL